MVRAIRAIAAGPQETKSYPTADNFQNALASTGYAGTAQSHIIRRNIYNEIPRLKNNLTKTEQSFIGNEIQSRGFRWQLDLSTANATGLGYDTRFRFCVYHENGFAGGYSALSTLNPIFDQDQTTLPTHLFWNPQIAKRIFVKTFTMRQSTQVNCILHKKFYVPLRRKVVSREEESVIANSGMGYIKGEQYYWVLECLSPASVLTNLSGSISTRMYFKDP